MTTQPMLPFTQQRTAARRDTKRYQVMEFFEKRLGRKVSSKFLHFKFGSAVRTRISEINRDVYSPIVIKNVTDREDKSLYWAERR